MFYVSIIIFFCNSTVVSLYPRYKDSKGRERSKETEQMYSKHLIAESILFRFFTIKTPRDLAALAPFGIIISWRNWTYFL